MENKQHLDLPAEIKEAARTGAETLPSKYMLQPAASVTSATD